MQFVSGSKVNRPGRDSAARLVNAAASSRDLGHVRRIPDHNVPCRIDGHRWGR